MARTFQFRVGDEVTFTLFEREMSGKVIGAFKDVLVVQLLEDPTVKHQIFPLRVSKVRRGGSIYILRNREE